MLKIKRMRLAMVVASIAFWLPPMNVGIGQVVQLPSVRSFGYSGTVTVPDAGLVNLGGISRGASGSSAMIPSRATGSSRGAAQANVSAVIIDLKAIDDMLLNSTAPPAIVANPNGLIPNTLGPPSITNSQRVIVPPDPNAWQMALARSPANSPKLDTAIEEDIRYYLNEAEDAVRQNRLATARVFHRLAIERMTPQMRARMSQRADEIRQASTNQIIKQKTGRVPVANDSTSATNPEQSPRPRF